MELRSPNWASWLNPANATAKTAWVQELTFFAFVDAAQVRLVQPLPAQPLLNDPGQAPQEMLVGTGVGLRLNARYGLSLALDLARPHKTTATVTTKDTRLHARLGWKF
jgi:hemolysin activation/secretion protein